MKVGRMITVLFLMDSVKNDGRVEAKVLEPVLWAIEDKANLNIDPIVSVHIGSRLLLYSER